VSGLKMLVVGTKWQMKTKIKEMEGVNKHGLLINDTFVGTLFHR
jgi:hypothetical protein